MNKQLLIIALAAATVGMLTGCQHPSEILAKQIKATLGPDVAEYQSLTYPTNDFGVATSYTSTPDKTTKVSDTNFLCSTWACLDIASVARPQNQGQLMHLTVGSVEYAQIGSGAPITLSEEDSTNYAFNILLPKIEGMLNLGVGVDSKNVTKVELTLGKATKRLLSKPNFEAFIVANSSTPTHKELQARYAEGGLTVVVGDIVIDSIQATVTTSNELAPKIDAKLATIPSGIVSDASTSFQITKSGTSTYSIKTTEPVIALRLLRAQPGASALSVGGWESWPTVSAVDPTTIGRTTN
ncbi:hypothetical protein ACNRBV_22765 [Ralstonia pseudosolanacearum]|uniref:hypothetical protein n=1 Tax=Ralstonia pseudosolanacearum TaxID=1310165 RepID=UPI0018A65B8F|nr:hypothetical protein [Ralstonia pseudosolanacearum]BCL90905.1 hypothetical protein MAFF211479_06060 [Ralstonia solanacearum]BCN03469.1 hypothetical protein RPSB_06060 [Ralstonia solanacearum]